MDTPAAAKEIIRLTCEAYGANPADVEAVTVQFIGDKIKLVTISRGTLGYGWTRLAENSLELYPLIYEVLGKIKAAIEQPIDYIRVDREGHLWLKTEVFEG